MTNKKFAKEEIFIKWCEKAGVTPTIRQASKFRNGKGLAYKFSRRKGESVDGE